MGLIPKQSPAVAQAAPDVLGQTPLRVCLNRRGYSNSGRNRSRYVARSQQRVGMERFPYDMTLLIDATRQEQKGRACLSQRVHVGQLVVLPQNRTEEERPSSRQTYDLALFIDAEGLTAEIARKLTQGPHAARFGPDEGFKSSCSARGRVGEADDRSLIIDRSGSVPGIASNVPKVNRNTVLPEHRMLSADTSDRDTTIAGDANHLTIVIDRCGGAGAVARQRREFPHCAVRPPYHRRELQDLERRVAGRIVNTILRPADHLTSIIDGCGVAAVTARERWQGGHGPVLPTEAFANSACGDSRGKERPTRKVLPKWIALCCLGNHNA